MKFAFASAACKEQLNNLDFNGLDDEPFGNGSAEDMLDNGPTARNPIRTKGLPSVLPDPGVQPGQLPANNLDPNAPGNAAGANPAASTTSAFGFFGHTIANPLAKSNSQPAVGAGFMQKIASIAAPSANAEGAPAEGLFSKGKDLIFKKFGL